MGYVVAATALLLGLIAGFALRKRTNEWCPACGCLLSAAHCPNAAAATARQGAAQHSDSRETS